MAYEPLCFPTFILFHSSHIRVHVLEYLNRHGHLIARDSATELLNQQFLKLEKRTKYLSNSTQKFEEQQNLQYTTKTVFSPKKLRGEGDVKKKNKCQVLRTTPPKKRKNKHRKK